MELPLLKLLPVCWLTLALCFSTPAATFEVAQEHPQAADEGAGTAQRPWKTLSAAVQKLRPGDVVLIRAGVYREQVLIKASGTAENPIRIAAAPGERVLVTGADELKGWQRADRELPIYRVAWPHRFITWNRHMSHPDDEYHRLIGRCEQVIIGGQLLRQVLEKNQLAPGTFWVDVGQTNLMAWDVGGRDLSRIQVEASVRQECLRVEGDFVQVQGLRFRYAANMAQHGAVVLAGHGDVLEDCVIESMNSSGASFVAADAVVRHCVFRDNGQLGFGASHAHGLLLTECLVENNNTKGFDRGWEAGGTKLVLTRGAILERSRFSRNRGSGVWFDIGNTNCTVRNCLIADNEDAGIFYEISFALHAQDNVIIGNGFATTPGAWGAQAGVSLSSSPGCLLERNLIVANREGVDFREQSRTTPTIEQSTERPVWNHDELIRKNLIAWNRDAQVWGWFDVKDNRHWPSTNGPAHSPPGGGAKPPADIAAPYGPASTVEQPQGLTLEALRIRFENNIYFAGVGQGWFGWGPTWTRHTSYTKLQEFQAALGLDVRSSELDPHFANLHRLDLRVPPETMRLLADCYPRGPVPGVQLGVLSSAQ